MIDRDALAAFLRGLAEGRGGELYRAARATCDRWALELELEAEADAATEDESNMRAPGSV